MSLSTTMTLSSSALSHRTRQFRIPSRSTQILRKLPSPFSLPSSSPNCRVLIVRNSGDITAKPSSEFRKQRCDSVQDNKLHAIRQLFYRPGINIDAYIIPSQDAHQSEFIAECYTRRAYISGFTGSAGTAVVTKDKAALWTDGRYFLQAEKQLSSSWILMRACNWGVPTMSEWLTSVLPPGCRIGIDPFLFSSDAAEKLKEDKSTGNHELVFISKFNLVDEIWRESRPQPPKELVRVYDLKYADADVSSKLISLRGSDVRHSPVMYAYLIVEIDGAKSFIDDSKNYIRG